MKVLVVAAEPVQPERLRAALGDDLADAEVKVVTPALNDSRLAFWVSDSDEAIAEADAAQSETVQRLRAEGVQAEGDTGESDPLVALRDALATFPADRVVIVRHPPGQEAYREDELVAEAERALGVPVVETRADR